MVILRIESAKPVVITDISKKRFMSFISRLINKRITKLMSRFDVPKVPPHIYR